MVFSIQNVKPIESVNISLGRLAIVCGLNNRGKTYLTYSLYALLDYMFRERRYVLSEDQRTSLQASQQVVIDLDDAVNRLCEPLSNRDVAFFYRDLPKLLARTKQSVEELRVCLTMTEEEKNEIREKINKATFNYTMTIGQRAELQFKKEANTHIAHCVVVGLRAGAQECFTDRGLSWDQAVSINVEWMVTTVVRRRLPLPFFITSERTGISIFREEFNILRALALEGSGKQDLIQRFRDRLSFESYPLPIRREIEFSLRCADMFKKESVLMDRHPKIMEEFAGIVGGQYCIDENSGAVLFQPQGSETRLSLKECSSSVRALCSLYFFLRLEARPGGVLMIDEPEQNLHPESQRRIGRFLVMLSNLGLRVFVTTHSDYIIREVNSLVVIKALPVLARNRLMQEYGLDDSKLPDEKCTNCYVINRGTEEEIRPGVETGFAVSSFDNTISAYNNLFVRVRDEIDRAHNNPEGRDGGCNVTCS